MDVGLRARQLDSAAGHLDRGLDQNAPREPSVSAMRRLEARDHARDGHGRRADQERLGRLAVPEEDVDRVHLPRPRPFEAETGCRHEEIGEPCRPVARAVDEHEAAGGGAREEALGDGGCERGCDAGVDGVSALLEHPRSRAGGERVAGGDGALHAGPPRPAVRSLRGRASSSPGGSRAMVTSSA